MVKFIKNEIVLIISALAALITAIFVPPNIDYLKYFDIKVLVLLFCLMGVISSFSENGIFNVMAQKLTTSVTNIKILAFILIMLCFMSSMFITNDVSLITFVPFTIMVLKITNQEKNIIYIITLQTIAANIGSTLTPVGNPQNLFLYSFYNLTTYNFFIITMPIVIIGFISIIVLSLFIKKEDIKVLYENKAIVKSKKNLVIFSSLFIMCILSVFNLIHYVITLIFVCLVIFFTNRNLFKRVDYSLLATFACFFIFVGNIKNIDILSHFISSVIVNKELLSSVVLSQFISNVPAAVMLSSFTDNHTALIAGTNIGGIGTLIGSLASLISYKFYSKIEGAKTIKYLLVFTLINIILLIILVSFALIWY